MDHSMEVVSNMGQDTFYMLENQLVIEYLEMARKGRASEMVDLIDKAEKCYELLENEERNLIEVIRNLSAQGIHIFE